MADKKRSAKSTAGKGKKSLDHSRTVKRGSKKASPAEKKKVFAFQRARSKAAKKGWRTQWRADKRVGKKGRQFVRVLERKERIDEIREARREEEATLEERLLESEGTTVVEDPVIRTGRKKK
jgi:hypothetical protein